MNQYVTLMSGFLLGLLFAILLVLLDGRFHNRDMFSTPYHMEEAIEQGEITKDEIILAFHIQIEENF